MPRARKYSDEERRQRHKDSRARHKASGKQQETARAYVLRCREADPTWQARQVLATTVSGLKRKYGLTFETRDALLAAQEGKCAICSRSIVFGTAGGAHVDHCHTTGRVRGILCGGCNTALGKLGDTIESLERVVRYLQGVKESK
jgi:hypothetical protein